MARVYALQHNGRTVATVLALGMGSAVATLVGMGYGYASAAQGYRVRVFARA